MIYENWVTPTTDDEWNAEIKLDSLHIKWHNEPERPDKYPSSQLDAMLASHKVKRDRVEADRVHVMERVILLIEKEIEFREQGTFERSPIGTEYFVDPGPSGNDTTGDGLSSSTAWKTYEKFSEAARSAGDRCTIRRDATPMWLSSHGDHTSDGELGNPITIEADYDDTWGDFANSTQTFTAVAGAKTMEASTTITGISVGDWCFVIGDDAREYCFEVKAVSGTTLTLWLPYIGETFGTGKTLTIMGPSPIQGDTSSIIGGYWNADYYWEIRGISYLGGHSFGGIGVSNGRVNFRHVISVGSGTGGFYTASHAMMICDGFRVVSGSTNGINISQTSGAAQFRNGDIDGVSKSADRGVYIAAAKNSHTFENIHIHDCDTGIDLGLSGTSASELKARNITFADNTNDVMSSDIDGQDHNVVVIEDFNGVAGDNRVFSGKGTTTSDAWLKTAQPTPPTDGANDSLWVVPGTYFGGWHFGGHNLIGENPYGVPGHGIPVYMAAGTKTFTLNFRSLDIADWTVNPTAAELFIEMEYLAHATNTTRSRKRSTETVDFAGVITWDTITLAVTAGQAGYAYLRVFYSKPKETSVTNEFYVNRRVSWA